MPTPSLLLRVSGQASLGGDSLNGGVECAVLDVTPELLDRLHRRAKLLRAAHAQDQSVYEMYFWGGSPEFYGYELVSRFEDFQADEEPADDRLTFGHYEDHGWALFPLADTDVEPERTECCQTVLRIDHGNDLNQEIEVFWVVSPRHCGLYVSTEAVALDELSKLVNVVKTQPA